MAQRRMVSVKIIDSAKFIKMPVSCQSLYFHLIARADDDGVVEAFNVMRMVGASEDDLKVLVAKQFATVLNEDLVTFINDWNEHNLIRSDRKIDSIYQDLLVHVVGDIELKQRKERADRRKNIELPAPIEQKDDIGTSQGQPNDSIGKGSIGEDSIVKHKVCASEIDLIWNMYPRKDGKKESYAKIPKIIKEIGIESLTQCIESYKQKIKTENIDKKFIMQGSTFFNGRYMDFIETQSSNKQEPKKINVVIVEG